MFRIVRVLLPLAFLVAVVAACQAPTTAPTAITTKPGVTAPAATATQAAPATTPTPTVERPRRGGTFRAGFPGDISDFDPHSPSTTLQHGKHAIYDNLLIVTQDLKLVPSLAESWEVSSDGLAVTLKLRKGVKFHDGTDFNAKAAKYSLDRVLTIQPKAQAYGDIDAVQEIETVDDYTIKLKLKNPSAILLWGLAEEGGMIVSPAGVEKWSKDFPRNPVGTGPYEFVEWIKNDHYTVKRFDGYWDKEKAGFFDQMVYRAMPDDNTRLAAFRSGQLDYVDTIPAKDIAILQADSNIVFADAPAWGWYDFRMNNLKPPFNNRALRQAVAHAIDREALERVMNLP